MDIFGAINNGPSRYPFPEGRGKGRHNCSLEFSQVHIPVVQSKLVERLSMSEFSQGFDHDGR